MTARIVKPKLSEFPLAPNMRSYEGGKEALTWDHIEAEISFFPNGGLNQAFNAIDRHIIGGLGNKVALHWIGKNWETETYTFRDFFNLTNRFANVLKGLGIKKGDRFFIFLDRVPELYIAVFGALKIGAVVGPLFSAFGPDAVADRLQDSGAVGLLTSPNLIDRVHSCLPDLPSIQHLLVLQKGHDEGYTLRENEQDYNALMAEASSQFDCLHTSREDYSVMHYTSGTTGKPKGAAHVHNAVIGQYATAKYVLDLHPEDVYWCTADPGWVTGTSYGMFGPWSNGVTQVVFEGGFKPEAWYKILQDYQVNIWYTAPTALRMLMKAGEEVVKEFDLGSLRHIHSVGEPLNPEAIYWGQKAFGMGIHDNWWQTETGAQMIANYPCMDIKPGSMGRPFPGISAGIIDDAGNEVPTGEEGHLALRPGWPSMFRTYWNKQELYDSRFQNGWYITGDRAWKDEEGYFWFVGREDDVINTAGHLVGPFEVESALVEHPAVAEAAVIGKPDPERMEIVKAFVSLRAGYEPSDELRDDIKQFVRTRLAAHAYPREIDFLPGLPKTRSGKIMRRLLKARELGLPEGDTSTLED